MDSKTKNLRNMIIGNTPGFPVQASQTQAAFAEELLPHAAESEADSPQAIDFDDAPTIFASKSTASLLQSYAILSSCRWKSLVTNAESLLQTSRALIGEGATEFLLEHTYYRHFCAGKPFPALTLNTTKSAPHLFPQPDCPCFREHTVNPLQINTKSRHVT